MQETQQNTKGIQEYTRKHKGERSNYNKIQREWKTSQQNTKEAQKNQQNTTGIHENTITYIGNTGNTTNAKNIQEDTTKYTGIPTNV